MTHKSPFSREDLEKSLFLHTEYPAVGLLSLQDLKVYLASPAKMAPMVVSPVSTPEAGIWLLWCSVCSPGCGWNGRATCWRTDSCSA